MKILLLPLLLFICINTYAQCEYTSKEIDEFKGTKSVITKILSVHFYQNKIEKGVVNFALGAFEGKKYVLVDHRYYNVNGKTKCTNGSLELLIKKVDGSVVELKGVNGVDCAKRNGSMGSITAAFLVDDSQLTELTSGIDKFRIQFSEERLDGSFGTNEKSYSLLRKGPKDFNSKFFFFEMVPCLDSGLADLGQVEEKTDSTNEDW